MDITVSAGPGLRWAVITVSGELDIGKPRPFRGPAPASGPHPVSVVRAERSRHGPLRFSRGGAGLSRQLSRYVDLVGLHPLLPWTASKVTLCPSFRDLNPPPSIALKCTKRSACPTFHAWV